LIPSASLKKVLCVNKESLIETWDESQSVGNGWVNHQMDTDHDVSKTNVLLYQTQGVDGRKGMEDEIEKIHI
jgi:hypothetical protein